MAEAAVLGYQTAWLGNENTILACAKHFAGDGGTTNGHDQGNTEVDEQELRNIHLVPYYAAVDAGVGSVMASFNSWNGIKMPWELIFAYGFLKGELGFKGFVVGDWRGINQVDPDFKTAIKISINAGVDMAMEPGDFKYFISKLTELVNEGEVSMDRIDDAVRRILTVKFEMGLFDNYQAPLALKDTVRCKTHRELARKAVRESVVLLQNDGIIPISKQPGKVLVAGSKGNDIGAQCGGWTVTWQEGWVTLPKEQQFMKRWKKWLEVKILYSLRIPIKFRMPMWLL
jgi:beta-glucosidase